MSYSTMKRKLHSNGRRRELARRASGGVDVRLLWQQAEGGDRLTVVVDDAATGERFELDIRAGESPLDVFHHPFAYAARRGISFELRRADTMAAVDPLR